MATLYDLDLLLYTIEKSERITVDADHWIVYRNGMWTLYKHKRYARNTQLLVESKDFQDIYNGLISKGIIRS